MVFKPVGVDENGKFPARVEETLSDSYVSRGELSLNVKHHGAKGDGTVDDTAAINASFSAAAALTLTTQLANGNDASIVPVKPEVYIPEGQYNVSSQLVIPRGVNLRMADTAKIRATAIMTSLVSTDKSVIHQSSRWSGGVLDCNGLAGSGFILGAGIACDVEFKEVFNPTGDAVVIGETGAVATSYEISLRMRRMWRPRATVPAADKAGLFVNNCSDSVFEVDSVRGFDVGSRNAGGDNEFRVIHPWNASGAPGPSIGHDELATANGTRLMGYVFDTPSLYGLRLRGSNTIQVIGGHFYQNSQGVDNTATAIYCDASPKLTALGCVIYGSGGIRWKKDIESVGGTANVRWLSTSDATTVVSRNWGDRFYLPGAYFNSGSLVPLQMVAGSADLLQVFSGATTIAKITKDGEYEYGTSGKGTIVKSPNGTRYRIGVNDAGAVVATAL